MVGFRVDTYDADFQHRFQMGGRQEIIWGLGYRYTRDNIHNSPLIELLPDDDSQELISGFIQDEIDIWRERAFLTLGTKIEHNDFTGFEVQPSARLLFKANGQNSIWLSVARAVRTPSRGDTDSRVRDNRIVPPPPLPVQPVAIGNEDFDAEELWAYEAGYRTQPLEALSVDVAVFYNDYDRLRMVEASLPELELDPAPPHLILPLLIDNDMKGQTYGIEIAADWQVTDFWRLQGAFSFWKAQLELKNSLDASEENLALDEGASPRHQVSLRSSFNLPGDLELDLWGRYVDHLPAYGISSYVTLDARIAWKPTDSLELAVVGQNLLDDQHPEFEPEFLGTVGTEIERSVYAKVTWRF